MNNPQELIPNRLYYVFNNDAKYIYKHGGIFDRHPWGWYWFMDSKETEETKFYHFSNTNDYQFEMLGETATFEEFIQNKPFEHKKIVNNLTF